MSARFDEIDRRGFLGGVTAGSVVAALTVAPATAQASEQRSPDSTRECDVPAPPPHNEMASDRAWARFLAGQDLIWKKIPASWDEAPFLGNGFQATMLYRPGGTGPLRLDVQHSEVQDHRREYKVLYGLARLPIGYFTLKTVGQLTGVDWRLDLWNATLQGTITTSAGTLRLRLLVHDTCGVTTAEVTPSEGERHFRWAFHPLPAVSDRAELRPPAPPGYLENRNPDPTITTDGDTNLCVQPMVAGGQTVTAWREVHKGQTRTLYCVTAHSFPDNTARSRASRVVRDAARTPGALLRYEHERGWHEFYRKSFLSFPDARLQSFYWIQLYKINSGTRKNAPVMATTGPWYVKTHWTAVWWNLNAQVENFLIHGSNHLELDSMTESFRKYKDNLVKQVEPEFQADSAGLRRTSDMFLDGAEYIPRPGVETQSTEAGNLLYGMFNVWLSWRHTMDTDVLRDPVYPVLRRAVNYYLHFVYKGPDGNYHIPSTFYPEHFFTPDCSYDLALLRWALTALLKAIDRLNIDDPNSTRYRDVLAGLVPQSRNDISGLEIGPGIPLPNSQAGYNYLLSIWPLYLITWDQPENRELIRRSLEYFWARQENWLGFTYAGAASQAALMGLGDKALEFLRQQPFARFPITPNTMYKESAAVIESPLGAAQGLHDMLCQSWGGIIRVFPAVPTTWRDVILHDFRTQGAFLVSAARRAGKTEWVRVRSLAGEPCQVRPGIHGDLTVRPILPSRKARWNRVDEQTLQIGIRRDEEVLIHATASRPDLTIAPVATNAPAAPWGLP